MLFSQRNGYKQIKNIIQVDRIDIDLRTGLWNCFIKLYMYIEKDDYTFRYFINTLWDEYFKKTIDTINYYHPEHIYEEIKEYFFSCAWYDVYDFLEYIIIIYDNCNPKNCIEYLDIYALDDFINSCNKVLEKENSGYRLVHGCITQITSDMEIQSIENIFKCNQDIVKIHMDNALKLLTDKQNPDYRNSIKESISAVEAICGKISKKEKATLGETLNIIDKDKIIHPALIKAFEKLYGYTSDSNGIRHALSDEPNLGYEDALYMLVICSAFINYLIEKTNKLISN